MSVLIVDDNVVLLQKMGRSISRHGYEILLAMGLQQARDILRTHNVTALCLDLQLPDGHGLDLLEEVRNEMPDLPVIIISGTNTPENQDRSWNLGVTAFLTKPFALSHLLTTLDSLSPFFRRYPMRRAMPAPHLVPQ